MAVVNRSPAVIDVDDVHSAFPEILAELESHPEVAYEVTRDRASAAIIIHPATFDRLIDAVEMALDMEDAETALTTEPLQSFADYHSQRLARGRAKIR